jgi:hypothetical protein
MAEPLRPGDVLVLCSDGLHGQVNDEEIGHLAGENSPEEACQLLIDLANDRGGPDNITVIVARAEGAAEGARAGAAAASAPRPRGRTPLPVLLLAFVVLVAAVVAIGGQVLKALRSPPGAADVSPSPVASAPPEAGSAAAPSHQPPVSAAPGGPATRTQLPVATRPVSESHATPVVEKPAPAAAAGNGTLFVVTRPFQPCDFFIDGRPYSEAVGFIRAGGLSPGAHSVKVVGRDGVAQFDIQLVASGVIDHIAELPGADAVGDVEIHVTGASAARIIIDGAQFPTLAPCTVRGLSAGTHQVRAIGQGAKPQVVDVSVDVAPHGSGSLEIPFGPSH